MKASILAVSAALVMASCTGAWAQANGAPGALPSQGATTCADVAAMEQPSQSAFLQGYLAGHRDAIGGAAATMNAMNVRRRPKRSARKPNVR